MVCHYQQGFTLIELMLVLCIMVIATTGVVLSVRGPYRVALLQNAREQMASIDHQLRDHAIRFGRPAELIFGLRDDTTILQSTEVGKSDRRNFDLGSGVRIDRVMLGDRRIDSGRIAIHFGPQGWSPTYALRLVGKDGKNQWLVFAGQTGQMTSYDDEATIDETFQILKPSH